MTDQNNRHIQLLSEVIAKGKLFTIVGTGVSRLATNHQKVNEEVVTSWPGLLSHGIKFCTLSNGELPAKIAAASHYLNAFHAVNDVDDLLKAASQIRKHLNEQGEAAMVSWLDAALGGLEPSEPQIIQALHQLPGFLATLNYDHLIEKVTQRKTITVRDTETIAELRRKENDERQFVIHIHGSYKIPKTCVLDVESYEEILRDTGTQTALQFFSAGHNLLFVGCGGTITDPNFSRLIQWGNHVFTTLSDLKHFVLCPEIEFAALKDQLGDLKCHWLKPLIYGKKHEELVGFLRSLTPQLPQPLINLTAVNLTAVDTAALPARPTASPAVLYYLNKLAADHQFLAMRGMNTDFGVELPIDQVYVPLTTTRGHMDQRLESDRARGLKGHHAESDYSDGDIELNDVFQECESLKYRGVILLGEPGAGKTTGARQLAWRLASGQSRPEDLGLIAGMRPVFLRLRNLDPTTIDTQGPDSDQQFAIKSLQSFLNQETHCPGGSIEEQTPGPDLWNDQHHGLLWILDGLDEVVDPKLRAIVAGWIRDILPERPRDRFFVTSRFQGYKNRDVELGEKFLELHVKPLSKPQIEQFVTKWFQAAHRRIDGDTQQSLENAASDQTQLFEVLQTAPYQAPSMLAMVANPMLLTIVCIVFKRDHNLPTARAELYKQCLTVLLESWRAEKFRKTRQRFEKQFDVPAARTVLAKLAWWMHQEKDRSEVPLTDLAKEAAQALQRVTPEANLGIDGLGFIQRMREESGILAMSGEGKGKIGFLHLSFQEYLTAEHAARQGLAQDLAIRVSESWWREVALLSLRCDPSEEYVRTFFTHLVSAGVLESNPDLTDRCIRETVYFTAEPFLQVLEQPDATPTQLASVLRVLRSRQKQVPQLAEWCQRLASSRHIEVRGIAREILAGLGAAVPLSSLSADREPYSVHVDDRTGQTLIWLPPGTFRMGAEKSVWNDERPVRQVQLTKGFYLGKYPVTNEQYGRFLEAEPGKVQTPRYWDDRRFNQPEQPVVGVSWADAAAYCAWAGGRLPTEAEWEYACRAGSTREYCFGDAESQLGEYAWYDKNSGGQTQPVGGKKANAWGLHDMHGNVWEWCQDWKEAYDPSELIDPVGPSKGSGRVTRGGSWYFGAADCRSAIRYWNVPTNRRFSLGFRLALSPLEPPAASK